MWQCQNESSQHPRISIGCCWSAGTAAIQVAKQIGAKIFTTAGSQEKLDFAKELGAQVLINYKEQDFAEVVKKETAGPEIKVSMHHVRLAEDLQCCGRLDAHPSLIAWHGSFSCISAVLHAHWLYAKQACPDHTLMLGLGCFSLAVLAALEVSA